MPNDHPDTQAGEPIVTRRESVRAAAIAALAAGLGVPSVVSGAPAVGRIQVKFYKALADGGALVGTVDLGDAVSQFLGSAAGTRGYLKWYDGTQEIASLAAPRFCCIKLTP